MPTRRPYPVLTWIAVALALGHALSFAGLGPCDDDFIVYRYARNLVAGNGLVFNPEERVEGFTVPLWLLLLAACDLLGLAYRHSSLLLGLLAQAWIVLSLARLWRALCPGARWPVPALLAALAPALAYQAALGLGTNLLAALLTAGVCASATPHATSRQRGDLLAGLWLGLACLLRHEALLFVGPFLLATLGRRRWQPSVLALCLPGAWFVFRWAYYGRLLPITYGVKKLALTDDLAYGLSYLGQATLETGIGVLFALALLAFVGRAGAQLRGLRWVGAGLALHTAYVVYVGGDYMPLARFFVPSLPLLLLFACVAVVRFGPACGRAALVLAALLLQVAQLERGALRARYEFQEERWIAIGETLAIAFENPLLYPDGPPSVATSPIGAIGYYSDAPIVDLLGITHTGFLEAEPDLSIDMKGHQRHDANWVLERAPELVILGNGAMPPGTETLVISAWERPLFEDPRFKQRYRSMVMPVIDSYPLIFYVRQDGRAPAGARPARQR